MKPQLSNFFVTNPIVDLETVYCLSKEKEMTLIQYSDEKGVKSIHSIDDNRSICQMLRNTNGLTNYDYHKEFIFLVNLANNAVVKLGSYSKVKDNAWGDKDKSRSVFTEDKRILGLQYLDNPHHNAFDMLGIIMHKTIHPKSKDYLVEVSYYLERVNNKLLEYEQKDI